ncbi:unnamed protein product [Dovyalis caffra]|uniref:Maturase K n=1 Tax=Dovyalis caffra TaxID=77055 RepID=A0AAV1QU66_9ROSI|nr:unnamed protein product [Dovyalis caffra]
MAQEELDFTFQDDLFMLTTSIYKENTCTKSLNNQRIGSYLRHCIPVVLEQQHEGDISIVKGLRSHFCSASKGSVLSAHHSNIDRMWTKQKIMLRPYPVNVRPKFANFAVQKFSYVRLHMKE